MNRMICVVHVLLILVVPTAMAFDVIPDEQFGDSGSVEFAATDLAGVTRIHVDSRDRIYVCGYAYDHANHLAVVIRMQPDGRLDRSFGSRGRVELMDRSIAQGIAFDEDGRIYVAVLWNPLGGVPETRQVVYRLTDSGQLDRVFGDNGKAVIQDDTIGTSINDIAVSGNRVVLLGYAMISDESAVVTATALDATGDITSDFGSGGTVRLSDGTSSVDWFAERRLSVLPGGDILATFAESPTGNRMDSRAAAIRLDRYGSVVQPFSRNATGALSEVAGADMPVAVDLHGRHIVALGGEGPDRFAAFKVVELPGSETTSAGGTPSAPQTFAIPRTSLSLFGAEQMPTGALVLAGTAPGRTMDDFVVLAVDGDGSTGFSDDHEFVHIDYGQQHNVLMDVAVNSAGTLYLAGYYGPPRGDLQPIVLAFR